MEKIFISTSSFGKYSPETLNLLLKEGISFELNPLGRTLTERETIRFLRDKNGLIAGTEPLTTKVFTSCRNLKVISRCGTGVDNIDLEAAKRRGIEIYSTPLAPTLAVAELTVGLILNLLRKINEMDTTIKDGRWNKLMGNLLYCKKVGIIGFGRIGQKVSKLLSAFEVELAYCDIEPKSCSIKCGEKRFKEILSWADIITLHLSPSAGCNTVIGSSEMKLMKKGSWLVNVSRGSVIEEKALYHSIKEGHLSGAALDVFDQEPYKGPLKELRNVILTPHIGSYAKEARIEMEKQAVENLLKGLYGFNYE